MKTSYIFITVGITASLSFSDIIMSGKTETIVRVGNYAGDYKMMEHVASNDLSASDEVSMERVTNLTMYNSNIQGSNGYFEMNFEHFSTSKEDYSITAISYGQVDIKVTEAVSYSISGEDDIIAYSPSCMYLNTTLYPKDQNGNNKIFWNQQLGYYETADRYTVGSIDGNKDGVSQGLLSGILDPGTYTLLYDFETYASNNEQFSNQGYFRIDFASTTTSVPEPSMITLICVALAGLVGVSRYMERKERGSNA